MAYFEEVRIRGLATQAETAALMGKSLRTVGGLERHYKMGFLAPEVALERGREVEGALDEVEARALAQVQRRVPHIEAFEVERLLESLAVAQRVVCERGEGGGLRYRLNPAFVSLVREDLDAQLDGLLHQLDVIVAAVRTRFLSASEAPSMKARTLSFVADPEAMEALGDEFVLELRRRCVEAEESALKRNQRDRYAVTFVLTPLPDALRGDPEL